MRSGLARAYVFFFFQAEDGIRDLTVTGVQTCALPICDASSAERKCGREGILRKVFLRLWRRSDRARHNRNCCRTNSCRAQTSPIVPSPTTLRPHRPGFVFRETTSSHSLVLLLPSNLRNPANRKRDSEGYEP